MADEPHSRVLDSPRLPRADSVEAVAQLNVVTRVRNSASGDVRDYDTPRGSQLRGLTVDAFLGDQATTPSAGGITGTPARTSFRIKK